jgi:rubredoxin
MPIKKTKWVSKWRKITMKKYVCSVCGYVYDEQTGDVDSGVAAGTVWAEVPEDYVCPLCGAPKDMFEVNS